MIYSIEIPYCKWMTQFQTGRSQLIKQTLGAALPPLNVDELSKPFDNTITEFASFDLTSLIDLQYKHQTKQALSGVWTHTGVAGSPQAATCNGLLWHITDIIKT